MKKSCLLLIIFFFLPLTEIYSSESDAGSHIFNISFSRNSGNTIIFLNSVSQTHLSYTFNDFTLYKYGSKIKLSKTKIAGAVFLTLGLIFLVTGFVFLASSLGYADYLEKNETHYDKYITGKNVSQGLFGASMGCLGLGAVSVIISIPLFAAKKKKR